MARHTLKFLLEMLQVFKIGLPISGRYPLSAIVYIYCFLSPFQINVLFLYPLETLFSGGIKREY